MGDAGLALQTALFAVLSAAGFEVFDGPPGEAGFPYVTIGPDLVGDISSKTELRREHRFAVTVWATGEAVSAVKPAMARIEAAVLAMPAAMGAWRLVTNDFLRGFTRTDPARGLVSGVCEFRARTERV